jgi:hypothetical protein
MLVSERFRRVRGGGDEEPDLDYEVDGWSAWLLGDNGDGLAVGGAKAQGMRRWKVEYGRKILAMAMCPEDNVIAVLVE